MEKVRMEKGEFGGILAMVAASRKFLVVLPFCYTRLLIYITCLVLIWKLRYEREVESDKC